MHYRKVFWQAIHERGILGTLRSLKAACLAAAADEERNQQTTRATRLRKVARRVQRIITEIQPPAGPIE